MAHRGLVSFSISYGAWSKLNGAILDVRHPQSSSLDQSYLVASSHIGCFTKVFRHMVTKRCILWAVFSLKDSLVGASDSFLGAFIKLCFWLLPRTCNTPWHNKLKQVPNRGSHTGKLFACTKVFLSRVESSRDLGVETSSLPDFFSSAMYIWKVIIECLLCCAFRWRRAAPKTPHSRVGARVDSSFNMKQLNCRNSNSPSWLFLAWKSKS